MTRLRRWMADHSLGTVLLVAWLVAWAAQFVFQMGYETADAAIHGQPFQWNDFWWAFFKDSFENIESELFQVFVFVKATKHWVERGSAESKDSDERLEAKVDDLDAKLERLLGASGPAPTRPGRE